MFSPELNGDIRVEIAYLSEYFLPFNERSLLIQMDKVKKKGGMNRPD
ncbi:hypothetical protein [Vibrio diabolicus]